MRWASAISDLPELDRALGAALDDALHELEGPADLVLVFASGHARGALGALPISVHERARGALLIGCSAGGVLGGGLEIESLGHGGPAVAVTAARLPNVELIPFHLDPSVMPSDASEADPAALRRMIPGGHDATSLLLLADPFSVDGAGLVQSLDRAWPGATKFGGLASGARAPGEEALFLGDATHRSGAVGIAMRGMTVETIVAQGCKPIGEAMFVTRHQGNVVYELNGKPVSQVVRALFEGASAADRELFRHSLLLGVGMPFMDDAPAHQRREYRRGDFVLRNIAALRKPPPEADGGLVVSARFGEYQVVQFHLRDAKTSAEDLELMLARHRDEIRETPAGALLFSCLGRGTGLYGEPNHDSDAFHRVLGSRIPLGGFFCNGEIGPVRGQTHLHGYTSSFALFRPA